ncbi:alpha-glucan family phosphorylase [Candidatus Woesearchaeota archaeon]|nr:alpha-glucan family phosphorylase [Nanoarchaeota archaeon]MCB9370497.1 alpha-glucan family phosphorylase [Candidatus Woesearchaeota archaeon]USN43575.1 MAG: alpha-glucan family phosphorylase [Candidatus Woesearchaeota archaeon]
MYENISVAYFSAEIGLDSKIKTYSGGLGILAGDTLKAMADLEVPVCGITLLYKKGFFKQEIIDTYQIEEADLWDFQSLMSDLGVLCKVNILGEDIAIKVWRYEVKGETGFRIPVFFLDTDLKENPLWAQDLTQRLYNDNRIAQEMILGIGGVRALASLGVTKIRKYHMNEGHSAFLTLELYKHFGETIGWDDGLVKEACIFTTHTPIPAGHDKFSYSDIEEHFKGEKKLLPWHLKSLAGQDKLNMTRLALSLSSYHNAVSRKHKEVSSTMFPDFDIDYITNGIHIASWLCPHMTELFDRYLKGWKTKYSLLEEVFKIPNSDVYKAHLAAKADMISMVNERNVTGAKLRNDVLTIGFARRFIAYKDAELIFRNVEHLKSLGKKVQFVFAGKSHMRDGIGKEIMRRVITHAVELSKDVSICFVPDYDIEVAQKLVSGVDVWLNTPIPNNEASGTSGMKAAANGVLHFSRLDGWAIEGFERNSGGLPLMEYQDLLSLLEYKLIPMFSSKNKSAWVEEMKLAIGNGASYFNTHRMVREYLEKGYKINLP